MLFRSRDVHVGFAIRRIPHEDIAETLRLYEELIQAPELGDLMATDVANELAAVTEPEDG